MKIESLELCNFRSAAKTHLKFNSRLNLLIGVNGSGKSTVLDALNICLSWVVKRIERDNGRGFYIPESSLRNGQDHGSLNIHVTEAGHVYKWILNKTAKGRAAVSESHLSGVSKLTEALRASYEENVSWPVIVYYPITRTVGAISPRITESDTSNNLNVYENALGGSVSYQSLEKLLLQGNSQSMPAPQEMGSVDNESQDLTTIAQAIEQFVPAYSNLRVKRTPKPHLLIEKEGGTFSHNQLSNGEKNLIALVGDIARRLTMGNPRNPRPLEGQGIVLIDEIDLHLHPSWQRNVIPKLLEVFPNCQFFISTHSPQVVSHAKPHCVFLLEGAENGLAIHQVSETYGMSLDRIVELVMGQQSP